MLIQAVAGAIGSRSARVAPPPSGGGSNPYAGLAAGAWQELSGTTIRSVVPASGWTGNPTGIVDAWSGGCVDTLRHRLLVWGGGHDDYSGNEVYAINFGATPGVARVWGPNGQTPPSMHTYSGLAYMAHVDRMFEQGGATYPNGFIDNTTWEFICDTGFVSRGTSPLANSILFTAAAYDPVTQRVYINDRNNNWTYVQSTGTYTNRGGTPNAGGLYFNACIDSNRRRFVFFEQGTLTYMHLDTFATGSISSSSTPTEGGENTNPGFGYDPVGDRFVMWSGGNNVYAMPAAGGAWANIRTSGGPGAAQSVKGTFGRWGYDPTYKVFVLCNSIDSNLYVFKLADGS